MRNILFMITLIIAPLLLNAQTELRLPAILSNHAVMQANSIEKLWGWGTCTIPVKIVCSWNPSDTLSVMPQKDCSWMTTVKTPNPGGPYSITLMNGAQRITISDLFMGQVWLCSGQSNMQFNYTWGDLDAGNVLQTCKNDSIRFFEVKRNFSDYPIDDCQGEWKICDSTTIKQFSLIGYFFGNNLFKHLHQPIGLIGSYWGGTCVQAWTPSRAFCDTTLRRMADDITPVTWAPVAYSTIYNAMIHPIVKYTIAGTIWYQGESNTEHPQYYGDLFKALITNWRDSFQQSFPFYFVQIAPFNGYPGINGALLREQQTKALTLPKTGMITIGDLVNDTTNIHPKLKKGVAERLANLVEKEMYEGYTLQPYQPHFASMRIDKNKIIITIASYGKLVVRGPVIQNFQIAGANKVFYNAQAKLEKNGTIVVTSPFVKDPVAVRYCFTNAAIPNLFDTNGLPLVPFRTDRW